MARVAILNSRQSKTPVGNDPWVRRTLAAVRFAVAQGWTVISSVGMNTWELLTWAVAHHRGNLEIVLPAHGDPDMNPVTPLLSDFNLDSRRVAIRHIVAGGDREDSKSWWMARDRHIIDRADVVLPVSLNMGGQLAALLQDIWPDQEIDTRFATAYRPQAHHKRQLVDTDRLTDAIRNWCGDFIIHWTRSSHGPWPGETRAQYYRDVAGSDDRYCRSAFGTLRRILCERTLRASSWRIAGAAPMVAFTELSPAESIPVMRWRPRWTRWSFEPYGIAIRRDVAERLSARPVRYVSEREWRLLPDDERPFAHRSGVEPNLWPAEREWRIAGSVDLSAVPSGALRIIVRGESEVSGIVSVIDAPVYPFTDCR